MQKTLLAAAAVCLILHGLIHLMGTTAYLKLGKIEALPYKTTLLGGSWDLGDAGIRVFGVLWVIPAVGFVLAAVAMFAGWTWWPTLVGVMAGLSLVLTLLDWSVAYAGAITNVIILGALLAGPLLSPGDPVGGRRTIASTQEKRIRYRIFAVYSVAWPSSPVGLEDP